MYVNWPAPSLAVALVRGFLDFSSIVTLAILPVPASAAILGLTRKQSFNDKLSLGPNKIYVELLFRDRLKIFAD